MNKRLVCALLLLLTWLTAIDALATDQNRPVMDVIIADVNGDLDGFLDRMKQVETLAHSLGLDAKLRVFQATFAGARAGEIHLYWELPSFTAFAEAETRLHSHPEFLAILGEMEKAGQGFRSEMLTIEVTRK